MANNQLKTVLGKTSVECYTPIWIFEKLELQFDLDVAAPIENSVVPAATKFTILDDGLVQNWHGRVWMNPPFSKPKPWVEKFVNHKNGIALLPTSTGKWQMDIWEDLKNKWVILPPMKFEGFRNHLPTRCFLIAYGDECINAISKFGNLR